MHAYIHTYIHSLWYMRIPAYNAGTACLRADGTFRHRLNGIIIVIRLCPDQDRDNILLYNSIT